MPARCVAAIFERGGPLEHRARAIVVAISLAGCACGGSQQSGALLSGDDGSAEGSASGTDAGENDSTVGNPGDAPLDTTVAPDSPDAAGTSPDGAPSESSVDSTLGTDAPSDATPDADAETSDAPSEAAPTDAAADASSVDADDARADGGDAAADASDASDASATTDASDASDAAADAADARAADAAPDGGAGSDAGDAGICTPLADAALNCNGSACSAVAQYCLFGSVPNQCLPLPPECMCAETRTCACLLASAHPCDGGTFNCADYGDAGLWYAVIAPHGPCL